MNKKIIESGIILGLISIGITVLLYLSGPEYMTSALVGIGVLVVSIALVSYFAIRYRKQSGGYISFKNGFIALFLMLFISGLLMQTFNILLYQVIDPELSEKIKIASIENTASMMQSFNAPQEEIDKAIDRIQNVNMEVTVSKQLLQIVWMQIYNLIIALIIALIIKKKNPDPFSEVNTIDAAQ